MVVLCELKWHHTPRYFIEHLLCIGRDKQTNIHLSKLSIEKQTSIHLLGRR
jgi:hypothetical protein